MIPSINMYIHMYIYTTLHISTLFYFNVSFYRPPIQCFGFTWFILYSELFFFFFLYFSELCVFVFLYDFSLYIYVCVRVCIGIWLDNAAITYLSVFFFCFFLFKIFFLFYATHMYICTNIMVFSKSFPFSNVKK